MSTVDPSSLRLPAAGTGIQSRLANALDTGATVVRGLAFWTTIPLPLVIVGALLTGVLASAPLLVVALVALNVLCAAVGQPYSPSK